MTHWPLFPHLILEITPYTSKPLQSYMVLEPPASLAAVYACHVSQRCVVRDR